MQRAASSGYEDIWWTTQAQRWNGSQWVTAATSNWVYGQAYQGGSLLSKHLTQSYTISVGGYWRALGWVYWGALGDGRPVQLTHTVFYNGWYRDGWYCQF